VKLEVLDGVKCTTFLEVVCKQNEFESLGVSDFYVAVLEANDYQVLVVRR
jgi:hypothetical protein